MKGFWGYLKGSLILQFKALPWLMMSPLVGAVRGAVVTTLDEIRKCDARIAEFQERYLKELDEEAAQSSKNPTAAS